jgi:hypothetical protein
MRPIHSSEFRSYKENEIKRYWWLPMALNNALDPICKIRVLKIRRSGIFPSATTEGFQFIEADVETPDGQMMSTEQGRS